MTDTTADAIAEDPSGRDPDDLDPRDLDPAASRLTGWLYLTGGVILTAGILFGYDQGVISGALRGIEEHLLDRPR